jgi:hypothetical protein
VTDIITELRKRHTNCTGLDPRITNPIVGPTIFLEAAAEIERLRVIVQGWEHSARNAERDMATLRAERDEARRACKAWEANLAEQQEVDPADLQALIDAAWKDDRLTVKMSARDLWRMATDRRGREEE